MLTNPEPMIASLHARHGELTRLLLGLVDGAPVADDIPAEYLLQFNYDEELVMDRLLTAYAHALEDLLDGSEKATRFTEYSRGLGRAGASQFLNIISRLTIFGDVEWDHYNNVGDIKSYMTKPGKNDYNDLINGRRLLLGVLADVVVIVFHIDSIEHLLRYGWKEFELEVPLTIAAKLLEDLSFYAAHPVSLKAASLVGKD
jgi:hypothetical protein